MAGDDGFLARWSRRKAGLAEEPPPVAEPASPRPDSVGHAVRVDDRALSAPTDPSEAPSDADPLAPRPETPPPPTLDDVARLTMNSDYSRFVARGVDPSVGNAAMKKLFADPHFNVMDGLDTYIDDYGKPDPIPLSMLRQMHQSKMLRLFEDEEKADEPKSEGPKDDEPPGAAPTQASPDGDPAEPVAQSSPSSPQPAATGESEPPSDDDADLRLQQDDAAGRPGPGPGAGS